MKHLKTFENHIHLLLTEENDKKYFIQITQPSGKVSVLRNASYDSEKDATDSTSYEKWINKLGNKNVKIISENNKNVEFKVPTTEELLETKLTQMKDLFSQIEDVYLSLPYGLQAIITDYHNYEGSIVHCYGAGITACGELLEDKDSVLKRYNDEYND